MSWNIVRSYHQFVNYTNKFGLPQLISFDYDLGYPDNKTGYDAIKWLVEYCYNNHSELPICYVHSANHNIRCYVKNAKKHLDI